MNPGFDKRDRSTFRYWFAHWCALNMLALNLKVWKPKYLLHDIEKPWLLLWFKFLGDPDPYQRVQKWHKTHRKHHTEYFGLWDMEEMVLDWECSRYTKKQAQLTALEEIEHLYDNHKISYGSAKQLKEKAYTLGLLPQCEWNGMVPNSYFQESLKQYPDDAIVCIEYCNPKSLHYNKDTNIINID